MKSKNGKFPFNSQITDAKLRVNKPCITFAQGLGACLLDGRRQETKCRRKSSHASREAGDQLPRLLPWATSEDFTMLSKQEMRDAKQQCVRRVRVSKNVWEREMKFFFPVIPLLLKDGQVVQKWCIVHIMQHERTKNGEDTAWCWQGKQDANPRPRKFHQFS